MLSEGRFELVDLATRGADRHGDSVAVEHKGPAAVVVEFIQNAWDQNVTRVDITDDRMIDSREVLA